MATLKFSTGRTKRTKRRYGRWRKTKSGYTRYRIPRYMKAPLPDKLVTKFKYHDVVPLNPTPGGLGLWVFSANGLYDPDIGGIGHQPRGFDELMTMYDHYVVTSARIKVTFNPSNNSPTTPGMIWISTRDSSTAFAGYNDYLESRNTVSRGYVYSQNIVPLVLTKKVNIGKFLGRSSVLSDPQLKGSTSGNPTEQAFFHVGVQCSSVTADGPIVDAEVQLEYYATLIEPKTPGQS